MTNKQERLEGTITTNENPRNLYIDAPDGGKATVQFDPNDGKIFILQEVEQEMVSGEEAAYRRLNNKIEDISEIVKELQQDIQQLKNKIYDRK